MKYLELTGYGNQRKHIIPLNKIVEFDFEEQYTSVGLSNGFRVNVVENESAIKELLHYLGSTLVSEQLIADYYEHRNQMNEAYGAFDSMYGEGDELPF